MPITVYELMGDAGEKDGLSKVIEQFEAGLDAYMGRKWDEAERSFQSVLNDRPDDGPAKTFLARVSALREAELPPDWDGVYVMTKK